MQYIFKLIANTFNDNFLYFMPFSPIKSQKITTSARKEYQIQIGNEFYLLCNVRSTSQPNSKSWEYMIHGNKFPLFCSSKIRCNNDRTVKHKPHWNDAPMNQ